MTDRLRFILPFGGILLVFALYSIYWFVASTQIRAAVDDWVSDQEAAGYVIEREALTVSGYPYRFQITFREPRITAPQSDGGWHAELAALQAHAVPYDLSHWIIRVDGHTDNVPLSGQGLYADNWELSEARALSVVRYLIDDLAIPPRRLSANGFGEYQPINDDDTAEARAQNRRIELKLTEQ